MIPPDWFKVPPFAQIAKPANYPKNVQICTSCGSCDVEVDTAFWRCAWCSWWFRLGSLLVDCYLGMTAKDGDRAASAWELAWLHMGNALSWPRYQRRKLSVRTDRTFVLDEADARALRLCWQFLYGVWPERLRTRNGNGYYDHGPAWRTLTPQTFRLQALAAARVVLRRVFARRAEVAAKAPPKFEMRFFIEPAVIPASEIVEVPDLSKRVYEDQVRAFRAKEDVEALKILERGMREQAEARRDLARRQRALADAYPEEYVVVLGDQVLLHTMDKTAAFARFHEVWEDESAEKPVVIPPLALRQKFRPVLRWRAI